MGTWKWIGRYALVLLAAVLLGAGLGELAVFKQTLLGSSKLSAAMLARLTAYGAALAILVLLGQRAARQLQSMGNAASHVGHLVLPVTLLVVSSAAYDVALEALHPFLSSGQKEALNWVFVLGISACAIWLVVELNRHGEGLLEGLRGLRARRAAASCAKCGAEVQAGMKFCAACGAQAHSAPQES